MKTVDTRANRVIGTHFNLSCNSNSYIEEHVDLMASWPNTDCTSVPQETTIVYNFNAHLTKAFD